MASGTSARPRIGQPTPSYLAPFSISRRSSCLANRQQPHAHRPARACARVPAHPSFANQAERLVHGTGNTGERERWAPTFFRVCVWCGVGSSLQPGAAHSGGCGSTCARTCLLGRVCWGVGAEARVLGAGNPNPSRRAHAQRSLTHGSGSHSKHQVMRHGYRPRPTAHGQRGASTTGSLEANVPRGSRPASNCTAVQCAHGAL